MVKSRFLVCLRTTDVEGGLRWEGGQKTNVWTSMTRFSQEGCVCGSLRGSEKLDAAPPHAASNLASSWWLPNLRKRFLVGENERGPKLVSRRSLIYPLPQAIPLLPSRAGVCHTEAKPVQVTQKSPTFQRWHLCRTGGSWGRSVENPLRTPPLVAPAAAYFSFFLPGPFTVQLSHAKSQGVCWQLHHREAGLRELPALVRSGSVRCRGASSHGAFVSLFLNFDHLGQEKQTLCSSSSDSDFYHLQLDLRLL